MKIISVVGARPNFMKIAPFCRAIQRHNQHSPEKIVHLLIHTGQHYDDKMSRAFFEALDIPDADINLGIGSGTHAEQVGRTMIEFEKVLKAEKPDWTIVVGDVNATCACSITARKEHVKLAHIEAGLRSNDMDMPEEINRLVTDRLSNLLFTPDRISGDNLRNEGVPEENISFVGNIMIDTLEEQRAKAAALKTSDILRQNLLEAKDLKKISGFTERNFAILTMHRPSNVDNEKVIRPLLDYFIDEVTPQMPLLWTVHPRTRKQLESFGLWEKATSCPGILLLQPLGYHELLKLNMEAGIIFTDSGGLQEECCVLGTPCLTMRWNTERPVTLREHHGASVLVGNDVKLIRKNFEELKNIPRTPERPELWDGHTADRIVAELLKKS